jgi:hypothetical protein
MRGNRRYVMSRANRRVAPNDGGIGTVDTEFLQKLITSGDTGFVQDLVAKDEGNMLTSNMHDEVKYHNPPRRWMYVLLGMAIMYLWILIAESRKTNFWWKYYMFNLKSGQLTEYDSQGIQSTQAMMSDIVEGPEPALYKRAQWDQTGSINSLFNNNQQMYSPEEQQQQLQQQYVPKSSSSSSTSQLTQLQDTSGTLTRRSSHRNSYSDKETSPRLQYSQKSLLQYPTLEDNSRAITGGMSNSNSMGETEDNSRLLSRLSSSTYYDSGSSNTQSLEASRNSYGSEGISSLSGLGGTRNMQKASTSLSSSGTSSQRLGSSSKSKSIWSSQNVNDGEESLLGNQKQEYQTENGLDLSQVGLSSQQQYFSKQNNFGN